MPNRRKSAPPGPGASPEELKLWRRTMAGVRPLGETGPLEKIDGFHPHTPAHPSAHMPAHPSAHMPAHPSAHMPVSRAEPGSGAPDASGPARRPRRSRGGSAIDARIDLHGLTLAQAHEALETFIDQAIAAGQRRVLVITGKGRPGGDEEGGGWMGDRSLRQKVPRWLISGPNRGRVQSVEPAQARHGGQGACYVVLGRKSAIWK